MRRAHTKSRKGCAQCKTRHVKCNEQHPACRNCQRLEIPCSFSQTTSSPSSLSPSSAISAAILHTARNGENVEPLPLLDLELMHNMITKTMPLFQSSPERRKIFADDYVKLGLSETYLLHSMMAISALHIYSQDRSRKELLSKASAHQNAALRLVQPILTNITEDNCIGVSAFSGFTSIYALAELSLREDTSEQLHDPIDDMLSCFHLSRGIKVVMGPFFPYMLQTWVAPAFKYEPHRNLTVPNFESDYGGPLKVLLNLVEAEENEDNRRTCKAAVENCFEYISILVTYGETHDCVRLIHTWPIEVGKDFLTMLAERQPLALVILAHYGVLMHTWTTAWWFTGLPTLLLHHIEDILDGSWSEALAWPRKMILEASDTSMSDTT